MQPTSIVTSSQSEPFVTTTEKPKPIRGGIELAIVFFTLPLPKELMEILVVVINIQEELITPKPIPLVLLEIGIGANVILITSISHASKVFRTPNIILKDTLVTKKLES
jgi:hypothetical protein